uniref:Uncharacterized protein n=1 Tax=Oryza punctata TaxID=4537 RepID=A0A0E0M8Y0_ORYPU
MKRASRCMQSHACMQRDACGHFYPWTHLSDQRKILLSGSIDPSRPSADDRHPPASTGIGAPERHHAATKRRRRPSSTPPPPSAAPVCYCILVHHTITQSPIAKQLEDGGDEQSPVAKRQLEEKMVQSCCFFFQFFNCSQNQLEEQMVAEGIA